MAIGISSEWDNYCFECAVKDAEIAALKAKIAQLEKKNNPSNLPRPCLVCDAKKAGKKWPKGHFHTCGIYK